MQGHFDKLPRDLPCFSAEIYNQCHDCYKDWMHYSSDNTGGVIPGRVLVLGILLRGLGSRRLIVRLGFEVYLGLNIF